MATNPYKSRLDVSPVGIAITSVVAILAAWVINVLVHWSLESWGLWTDGPVFAASQVSDAYLSALASPYLGFSLNPWCVASSALIALLVFRAYLSASRFSDLDVSGYEQGETQVLAKPGDWDCYTHVSEWARVNGKKTPWPKPEWCEKIEDDNIIVSSSTKIGFSDNPDFNHNPKNRHMFVVAGSGSGKTYNFVTSNVLQLNASYVFTDPKGELFNRFAMFLQAHGYVVRSLDLRPDEERLKAGFHYNPLAYCKDGTQVNDFVDKFVAATSSSSVGGSSNEDYFVNMEKLFYAGILKMELFWFAKQGNTDDFNLPSIYDWLQTLNLDGNDTQSILELVFFATTEKDGFGGYEEFVRKSHPGLGEDAYKELAEWEPIVNFKAFISMAKSPETVASVVSSCFNRLRPFMNPAMRSVLMGGDELELEQLGQRKQALFILMSDNKGPYDALASILVSQLFSVNARIADDSPSGHLKIPVICYLDEIANIAKLPNLAELFATLRSRWINLVAITQYLGQLKATYKDAAEGIEANCAIFLYLGGGNMETCKQLSERIGKHSVKYLARSTSRSNSGYSVSEGEHFASKDLISASELYNLSDDDQRGGKNQCLVHLGFDRWLLDEKPDPKAHPRFKELNERDFVLDVDEWIASERKRRDEAASAARQDHVGADGRMHYVIHPESETCVICDRRNNEWKA